MVLFGDSLTANGGGPGALSGYSGSLISDFYDEGFMHWANGWLDQPWQIVQNLSIGGSTVLDYGVASTTPMVGRYKQIFNYSPGWVTFLGGINDYQVGGFTRVPTATVFNGIKSMLDDITYRGIRVILFTLLPVTSELSGISGVTLDYRTLYVMQLNDLLRRYARQNPLVYLVDAHQVLLDTTSALGFGVTNYYYDGLHLSPLGAYTLGNAVYTALAGKVTPIGSACEDQNEAWLKAAVTITNGNATRSGSVVSVTTSAAHNLATGEIVGVWNNTNAVNQNGCGYYPVTVTDSTHFSYSDGNPYASADGSIFAANGSTGTQLFSTATIVNKDPLNAATGGTAAGTGVSGTIGSGLTITGTTTSGTTVGTVVARTVGADGDAFGSNQVLTLGGTWANTETLDISVGIFPYKAVVGDSFVFEGYLSITGMPSGALNYFSIYLQYNNGSTSQFVYGPTTNVSHTPKRQWANGTNNVTKWHFRTPAFTVTGTRGVDDTASRSFGAHVFLSFAGNASGAVVKLGRATVRHLTPAMLALAPT